MDPSRYALTPSELGLALQRRTIPPPPILLPGFVQACARIHSNMPSFLDQGAAA